MTTDFDKMQLAFQRVLDHIKIQPHETCVEWLLQLLIEEMETIKKEGRP
jgi:hypothetical protein